MSSLNGIRFEILHRINHTLVKHILFTALKVCPTKIIPPRTENETPAVFGNEIACHGHASQSSGCAYLHYVPAQVSSAGQKITLPPSPAPSVHADLLAMTEVGKEAVFGATK